MKPSLVLLTQVQLLGDTMSTSDFTIAFLCHDNFELASRVIEQTLYALTHETAATYDTILVIDGTNATDAHEDWKFIEFSKKIGIDEVRLRDRSHNCAKGDPSNNAHLHVLSNKTPYLITFESDVVLFKLDRSFDILSALKDFFEAHPNIHVGTKIDDYDCWKWKLEFQETMITPTVASINRVASHFLIYNTEGYLDTLKQTMPLAANIFYDDGEHWFNYEDYVSKIFAKPNGPGIAFFKDMPMKIFHCDIKIDDHSAHYTKDRAVKLNRLSTLYKLYGNMNETIAHR